MSWFKELNPIIQAIIATIFTWGITALGSLIVCFFKEVNKKILNTVLGFSAGVMIAASFWSLLIPAIDLSVTLGYIAWLFPALGFIIGGLFVLLSDKFLDKVLSNRDTSINFKRSILLISAITIHNIPEGMAIGVAFGGISNGGVSLISALMLAVGIGIQNFPEGAAVSLPLRSYGYSRLKSFMYGQASGLVEPISAIIGVILVLKIKFIMPFLLSFAAGAMICVVARELLPESITSDKDLSTLGMIVGFVVMMILDIAI